VDEDEIHDIVHIGIFGALTQTLDADGAPDVIQERGSLF
jgi:hypothetical protein